MAYQKNGLNNREIYELLLRIDKGYSINSTINQYLRSVKSIEWKYPDITKLPNSVGLLTSLSYLDVSGTKVSDICVLSNLTSLSYLYMSGTKVSDIGALSNLTSLSCLDISNTGVSDIGALSNLTSLSYLYVSGTKVSDICVLSNLTSLSCLDISNTRVSEIGALSNLTSLSRLGINNTRVSDISALSNLKSLVLLELSRIEINDLGVLSSLSALKVLNLQYSTTTAIPESVLDLDISFITDKKDHMTLSNTGIFIHGLTLTEQPIEIFGQSNELIRAYYRERKKVAVNECKVIFLGDAESGKTHSIRRLLKNGEYLKDEDFDGKSTPGIETTVSKIK